MDLTLDEIQMEILKVLETSIGLRAEFEDNIFTLHYLKAGHEREFTIKLLPSRWVGRERWFTEVVPKMNALAEGLTGLTKGLNMRFNREYINMLKELSRNPEKVLTLVGN